MLRLQFFIIEMLIWVVLIDDTSICCMLYEGYHRKLQARHVYCSFLLCFSLHGYRPGPRNSDKFMVNPHCTIYYPYVHPTRSWHREYIDTTTTSSLLSWEACFKRIQRFLPQSVHILVNRISPETSEASQQSRYG